MKILVVEDDEFVARALTAVLTNQTYAVEVATDGQAAWDLVQAFEYDLIMLDVTLPLLDGISLCRRIRSQGLKIPILLLTGRDSSHDKAIGLDAGADDYLVKPFDTEELFARVRALLRRGSLAAVQPVLKWCGLQLDPSSCEVTYEQKQLALTPKEYALLELFMRNSRRVFSCGMILEHLWSYEDTPGEEAVRTHIKGLRQKLKAAVGKSDLIETVYGIGYRLKAQEKGEKQKLKTRPEKLGKIATNSPVSSTEVTSAPHRSNSQKETLSAIAGVWDRFKGRIGEQINVLGKAAQALSTNTLDRELRELAHKEAHTLAGSLGTFGFATGSKLAKEIENLLKSDRRLESTDAITLNALVLAMRQESEQKPQEVAIASSLDKETKNALNTEAHILAVDDDPTILLILQNLLSPWGFKITTLDRPQQFWETLEATSPDLLILDVEMPQVNGIELCQGVRQNSRWRALPILFLTVHNDAEILDRVFSAGADDFVNKPIVGSELVTRIINRLELVKLRRRMAQTQQKLESRVESSASIAALQESEQRLRWALEAAVIGIWDWDLATNKIIWSIGHEQLFGLAAGTFDGKFETFNACILPADRATLTQSINIARQEKTEYCHEFRVVWSDGSIHWIEGRGRFFYNEVGEPVRMLGTVRDISPRKQAEAELTKSKNELELRVAERTAELILVNEQLQLELTERQYTQEKLRNSQALFAGIVEIADDAIVSIDSNQFITLFNTGAEKIFGYSAAEVLGKPLDLLLPKRFSSVHRQHVAHFSTSPSLARRMGERSEIYGCHKDGTEFPAEATISKLNLERETIYTVYLRDVSDRKQVERMKDEFVSIVSHELRTPLTSIHGSLGMLSSGLLQPDSQQGKRLLQIATDSTERLVRLINDILDIERIESGKVKMEKESCNVADLVEKAVNIMQPLANKASVTLSISSLSIQLWADPDRIVQVLTNLLSNAIKFSLPNNTVWLIVAVWDKEVLFTVKDRGRGIPADKLDSIFERFQQVDSTDARKHEGTGLGLSICRSIVQQHNGRLWVESVLGNGSSFYFTLPIFPTMFPIDEVPEQETTE
jgi:PAS domain S-box-containing protein